jgi:hypothetical protein
MRTAALAGLAVLAVGCYHAPASRFEAVLQDPAKPHWIELTSRHFTLRTDLAPRQARAALVDFEGVYGTLERVAFNGDAPHDRIDVVLFTDEWRFREVAPTGANGYFMPRQPDDPEPQPTIAIHGRMLIAGTLVEATQRRFRHELTHRFLDHRLRWTPPWLEEGIAEYYSTLEVNGKYATVGLLPNKKLLRVDIHIFSSLVGGIADDRVDLDQVPTVEELLTADYATFHQPGRELAFYAGAWTFVHMMLNSPHGYAPHFTRFLDMLANGATPPEAWRECFWGVPLSRLERQFKNYVKRNEMDANAMTVPVPKAAKPESERVMGDEDVHLMLARIRPWDSRENILAAGRELAEARALAGDHASPELRYWSALYDARWRRFDAAARELRAAIAAEPGRARYWLALADVLAHDERADATELDEAVTHLVPIATTPSALNFIARYYSQKGQVEAGLPFAKRAVAIERGCWECADTLAVLQNLSRAATDERPADNVYTKPGIY